MKRFLLAALVAVCFALPAVAQLAPDTIAYEEIGSQVINPVASTALTVPAGTQYIVMSVRDAGIHVSFDATAATTNDLYCPPNIYTNGNARQIAKLRIIDSSDGAATVYVKYFRKQRP